LRFLRIDASSRSIWDLVLLGVMATFLPLMGVFEIFTAPPKDCFFSILGVEFVASTDNDTLLALD
jgi:uncharacterized protein (DUF2062 family)